MHFSPAVRPLLQADRPDWSVASDAEGASGERRGPFEKHRTADVVVRYPERQPGGLRKGEAVSTVPRSRKHRVQRDAQRGSRGVERSRAFFAVSDATRAGSSISRANSTDVTLMAKGVSCREPASAGEPASYRCLRR